METQLNKYTRYEILINVFDIREIYMLSSYYLIFFLSTIILVLGGRNGLINYIKINLMLATVPTFFIITLPLSNVIVLKKFKITALIECIKKRYKSNIGIIKSIQAEVTNPFRIQTRGEGENWKLICIRLLIDDEYYYINGWHFSVNENILYINSKERYNYKEYKEMAKKKFIENWTKENRISVGSKISFDFLIHSKYIIDIKKISRIKQNNKTFKEINKVINSIHEKKLIQGGQLFIIMFGNSLIILIYIFDKIIKLL